MPGLVPGIHEITLTPPALSIVRREACADEPHSCGSEGDLRAAGESKEMLADLARPGSIQPVDIGVLALHVEPAPVLR